LEILFYKQLSSTHTYLKQYLKNNAHIKSIAIVTSNQTSGIGSRDNKWDGEEGNLYFSFAMPLDRLPEDLPIESSSIYFSYILKEIFQKHNSNVIIKWPNDFYINNNKVGGTMTNLYDNILLCGIGINLDKNKYEILDIKIDIKEILTEYFSLLESKISWKQIFSKFSVEFYKNKDLFATIQGQKISLKEAILNKDGSLTIDNKKVFSLR
jgi:BirA family biotin operon repressor/biotin-[acetyl-CoA-carboxylase] ligase